MKADWRCIECNALTSVRCYPTMGDPIVDPDETCFVCNNGDNLCWEDGSISFTKLDNADAVDHVIHIVGQLSPRWCRIGNFHLRDEHGNSLSPFQLGQLLTKLIKGDILEKRTAYFPATWETRELDDGTCERVRLSPAVQRVQYRLTESGLETFYSLFPEERPPIITV